MARATTKRILSTRIVQLSERAFRHVHKLECGHEITQAPRPGKPRRRTVCLECSK